ncbi:hypothetical protein EGT74_24395 [Chitinophaga lutea]|uniref:DUF7167 domain-containing protein n=1 Tax=Chitinophaga lutea TaxID=2488634 RepID=A0A3N4PMI8_9BACT|nr:hypothetical protein [Chitinophaga lutea]RPE05527.1 hypothetical protein EGT74_24395 [Chitinophaga lutea]
MKTIQVDVSLSVGIAGANRKGHVYIEVDEDATQEEIEFQAEEAAKDWANNFLDIGYEIVDDQQTKIS